MSIKKILFFLYQVKVALDQGLNMYGGYAAQYKHEAIEYRAMRRWANR